jgi:hypothetical protein
MMWFLAGYLLVAAAFYGYISATAAEEPSIALEDRATTHSQSADDLRKAA